MCFVPVEGKKETYRHVSKTFIHKINVDQGKLAIIAELLNVPGKQSSHWKPGKLLIVNDGGSSHPPRKSKRKKK